VGLRQPTCSFAEGSTLQDILLAVGFGLVTAAIISLSTVALSLQYSVTNIPNFAHGELMTLGAYGALVAQRSTDNIVVQALAAALVGGMFAWAMNYFIIQPFNRRRPKNLVLFILTLATSLILQNAVLIVFGGSNIGYSLPASDAQQIGPFIFTAQDLMIMGSAVGIMIAVHLLLRYTKFGKAQRAISDNRELARVTGINADRIVQLTWLVDGLIAGFAGFALGATVGSLSPTIGNSFLLITFAAAIVGGIGRIYGAMAGALLIGLAMEISALYLPADYKVAVAFLLLILTLLIRPQGLFATNRVAVR
jgi:branched-subunit amino acid ABC-type transport system permease component